MGDIFAALLVFAYLGWILWTIYDIINSKKFTSGAKFLWIIFLLILTLPVQIIWLFFREWEQKPNECEIEPVYKVEPRDQKENDPIMPSPLP